MFNRIFVASFVVLSLVSCGDNDDRIETRMVKVDANCQQLQTKSSNRAQWENTGSPVCSIKGETGPKGDTGAAGVNGKDGIDGAAGKNAFVETRMVYVNSQCQQLEVRYAKAEQWQVLGSLICSGRDGVDGKDGVNGANGSQGIQGDVGPQGEKGEVGAQGEKGEKGDTGAQGKDGKDGKTGAKGAKGDKGDPGLNGKDGAQGIPGEVGPQGPAGKDAPASLVCTIGTGNHPEVVVSWDKGATWYGSFSDNPNGDNTRWADVTNGLVTTTDGSNTVVQVKSFCIKQLKL